MRRAIPALLVVASIAACGANAAAPPPPVKVVFKGTCSAKLTDDVNGVVRRSTLTCNAKAQCACQGATQLVYQTATVSAGNGGPGRERGTIVASGPHGSVTLELLGTRSGLGASSGTWTLGKRQGSYTSQTTDVNAIIGELAWTVHISAVIGCWACAPAS